MSQTSLFPSPSPRELGEAAAHLCTDKAERVARFDAAAAGDYIVRWLTQHGATSGEDLVDACKLAGHVPHDDRAFGSVFQRLAQADRITQYGFAMRRKGHGTNGATIWRAVRGGKSC